MRRRAWYGWKPSSGSTCSRASASGFSSATCSISTPPSVVSMKQRLLHAAVERDREVVLLRDVGGLLDPELPHDVAVDVEAEDVAGLRLGVGGIVGELDAARLAAAAGQNLSLDDDRPAELLGRGARLFGRRREPALRDGDAEAREELLALVLVEIHRRGTRILRRRADDADHLTGLHRLARRDRQLGDAPARCACTSFSIFIASTMQSTWPASTSSPSATSTASTVPCIGLTTASFPPACAAAARRSRRRRASSANGGSGPSAATSKRRPSTSTAAHALAHRRVRPAPPEPVAARSRARRARRHQLRLDEAVTRLALDEARMRQQRLVEADQRLDAADRELVERAQHPPARMLAIDAVHDELRDHRVVQRRDLACRRRRRSRRGRPGRTARGSA